MKSAKDRLRFAVAMVETLESRMMLTGVAPSFTSGDLISTHVGASVSFLITTDGSPAPQISESGSLPSGLKFVDNGDGTATISGIPTGVGNNGVFNLKLTAKNSVSVAKESFTVEVNQIPKVTSLNNAIFNTVAGGSFTIKTAPDGFGEPVLSIADLPTGATFVDNGDGTGTLTVPPGSVVAPGYYATDNADALMVSASNSAGSIVKPLFLTIDNAPTFTSAAADTLTVDEAGLFTITTSSFPISQLVLQGDLPKGLTFKQTKSGTLSFSGSATISGTPLQSGIFPLAIIANNRLGSPVKQEFTLTVDQAAGFTTLPTATFKVGKSDKYVIKTEGFPPAPMTETGALPAGVTFTDNGNGTATLLGIPEAGSEGVYHFTVFADFGLASQFFTLTVD